MKNAVLLTFLTYWQLLPVKSLFLKGTLLWAEAWYIHWHGLQDSYHGEQPKAVQGSAVLQATCYHTPAAPSPDGQGQEQSREPFPKMGKPAGPGRSISPDNGGVWVLKKWHIELSYPFWIPHLGYCSFYQWENACLPPFLLLSDEERRHLDAAGRHKAEAA